MAEKLQVYKCEVCGNIITVLYAGGGELVCCGQPMKLLTEKTADQGKEKHVPVVEIDGNRVRVKVGSVQHPMEENHYIQWIEVQTENASHVIFLKPGDSPEAEVSVEGKVKAVREHCNLHGLWKKEVE